MRYYKTTFQASADRIEDEATVKFKEYRNENTFEAMNGYLYRNAENDVRFFVYRTEGNLAYAAFSYDEQKRTFQDASDYMKSQLEEQFRISKFKNEPVEATMYQFFEFIMEGRRRGYVTSGRYIEDCNLDRFYPDWRERSKGPWGYEFDETIIPERDKTIPAIYDPEFVKELSNIEENSNSSELIGNPVHYVITAKSKEVADELTVALSQSLLKAKRIRSRRISLISEIHPRIFNKDNRLEDIIENNHGGVVAIDLSEQFGRDPETYTEVSMYLAELFKRYRNQCLFIFTYNVEKPGFAYYLLKQISNYAVTITLKEGRGDRKAALSYLKSLIKNSEYFRYARQAGEFLKSFPGNTLSQTDVFMAYDRFGPWCINKNVLHAYDYRSSDPFAVERSSAGKSAYDSLDEMIGLDIVKKQIDGIIASYIVEKERKKHGGSNYKGGCMHMVFSGNPGTAKTTVARLFAGIAKEKGILKSGIFVDRSGVELDGLIGDYMIRKAFTAAEGGVLFIDEAYAIQSSVAITALLQELENQRDNVIVILAGYNERMKDFMKRNEGLKSRLPHWVDFPDYSTDELTDIFKLMVDECGFKATSDAVESARYIFEKVRNVDDFGNGRYVRNLIDRAIQNQSVRLLDSAGSAEDIRKKDLFLITKADISSLDEGLKHERPAGTAGKELDELIGLSSAKEILHKALANYKLSKLFLGQGISREKASMHMVFTGNPGTAKTTVARLFAEILRDEKVLSAGTFTEVGRADLVGQYTGQTAPLIKKRFQEAKGGVLFIDEAYSLCDDHRNGYGDEAINTIVQEMENHRDDVIVIFAGYPEPMERFLERNPGMRSRIAFHVEFDDYSTDELCEITTLMAGRKGLTVTDAAMKKLRDSYDAAKNEADYGNGRFVRKMLEEAEMNMAVRLMEAGTLDDSTVPVTTIEECDIPEMQQRKSAEIKRIGYVA